jgi:prepilin-type N-terminal cleavage/methylation domain-containing protein
MHKPNAYGARTDAGFSLIELIMALFVLAFGVIGLASTTLFVTRQLTLAEVTTARVAAVQSVMERIRATPFDSIGEGGDTIGPLVLSWKPAVTTAQTKSVLILTVGPGLASISETGSTPMLSSGVTDTVMYKVLRP